MYHLSNLDSPKILTLLESICGTKLPKRGFLAGQAVSSAILYLKGIRKHIHINDLDVFHVVPEIMNTKGMIKHNHYTKAGAVSLSMYEVQSYRHEGAKSEYEKTVADAILNMNEDDMDGYEGVILGLKDQYLKQQNIIKVNNHASFANFERQGYTIYDVFRNGMVNSVIVKARDLSYNSIINEFDINATMVGICLETGQLYYTYEFIDFLQTKELKVTNSARPYHTLVRLIKKGDELSMPYNEELALDILNTVIHLSDSKVIEDMTNRERDKCKLLVNDSASYNNNRVKLNLMGKVYKEKVDGICDFPTEYSLNNIQVEKKIRTKSGSILETGEKYDLYSFKTSMDMPKYISSGKHIESIEKRTDSIVLGYPTLLKYMSAQILTEHYKNNKQVKVFVPDDIRTIDENPYGVAISNALIANTDLPKFDWSKGLTESQYKDLCNYSVLWRMICTSPIEKHHLVLRYKKILGSKKYKVLRFAGWQNRSRAETIHAKLELDSLQERNVTRGIEKHLDSAIEELRQFKVRKLIDIPDIDIGSYTLVEMNSSYAMIENAELSGKGRTPIHYNYNEMKDGNNLMVQIRRNNRYVGFFKIYLGERRYRRAEESILERQKTCVVSCVFSKTDGYNPENLVKIANKYMEKLSEAGIINSLINEYHKPTK